MLPDLSILLALLVGLGALDTVGYQLVPSLVGTAASIMVSVALTWMNAERGLESIRRGEPPVRALRWATGWAVLGWLVALFFFDWGAFVGDVVPRTAWLLRYAVLFLPAGVMWAFAWRMQGRLETALGHPEGGVRPAVRRNGLALIPLFLLLGILDGIWLLGAWGVPGFETASRWIEALPLLAVGVMLAIVALLTLFLPLILRRIFDTEPLPPGPLRSRLEGFAEGIGLRYREIVVWKTRHRMINAMVVGFTPRTRMVFLTDGLLVGLSEEEILAVFGHEAGHAKKFHLPLFLLLFAASGLLFQVMGDLALAYHQNPLFLMVLHLAFLWFVLLGSVSRLLEREADIFGADHAGAPWMIRALQHVGQLSGRSRSHRHGTIEERVQYLAQHATDPTVRADFTRHKRRLLLAAAALALAAVTAAAWRLPAELAYARADLAMVDAGQAYEEERWEAAYTGFDASARRLDGRSEPRAHDTRVLALYNRADTALHGQADEPKAHKDYDTLLEALEGSEISPDLARWLGFQARVDRGRILAHEGRLEEAAGDLERAEGRIPSTSGPDGAWHRARLGLLQGALAVARGAEEEARRRLEDHVLRAAAADGKVWDEVRQDARLELDRLP